MSRIIDKELETLFTAAERRGRCVRPATKRLAGALSRRLPAGGFRRVFHGMYARTQWWNSLSRQFQALAIMRTLQDAHPEWVFCHESAGIAHGLPVDVLSLDSIHLMVSGQTHDSSRASGVRRHRVDDVSSVRREGLNVTTLEQTAFDCMRTAEFPRALAIADALVKLSGRSTTDLCYRFLKNHRGAKGVRHAARTLLYANAQSDNGGESYARGVMIKHGFALPRLQVPFPHPADTRVTYRVDYVWTREDGSLVFGELDGMGKYQGSCHVADGPSVHVFADERKRESMLSLYGAPIVRFAFSDVLNEQRFCRLLKQFGVPQSDGIAALEGWLSRTQSVSAVTFEVFEQ